MASNHLGDQRVAYVHERIERPTVIVGNSLGGFAALAAGAALGENLSLIHI